MKPKLNYEGKTLWDKTWKYRILNFYGRSFHCIKNLFKIKVISHLHLSLQLFLLPPALMVHWISIPNLTLKTSFSHLGLDSKFSFSLPACCLLSWWRLWKFTVSKMIVNVVLHPDESPERIFPVIHFASVIPERSSFYDMIWGYFDQVKVKLKVMLCP